MDAFLEVFGDLTVANAAVLFAAVWFLAKLYRQTKQNMLDTYKADAEKDKKIKEVLEQAKQYPKWHQQSIEIQKKFSDDIAEIKADQLRNSRRLDQMEEASRRRARNQIRDRLLQAYRYYTNTDKNPMQAWSEMEADAFWKLFGEYDESGGNGHVHTEIQPAMRKLEEIRMDEPDRIAELMRSRG